MPGNFRNEGYGVPVIADSAREDNQCVIRGQIIAGPNIIIEFFDEAGLHKIRWSALFPELAQLVAAGMALPRMMHCLIDVLTLPDPGSFAATRKSLDDGGIFFGTAKEIDMKHNWNLSDMDAYIATVKDITRYSGRYSHYVSPQSHPKHHGIDEDTVRLHFPHIGSEVNHVNDNAGAWSSIWRANPDSIIGDTDHFFGDASNDDPTVRLTGFPRYFVTLMEKV